MPRIPQPHEKRILWVSITVGLAVVIALLALVPMRGRVYARCVLLPSQQWTLTSPRPGALESESVDRVSGLTLEYRIYSFPRNSFLDLQFPGFDFEDKARLPWKQGQLVANIISSDLDLDIAERRTALDQAKGGLSALQVGAKPEEVDEAEVALRLADAALEAHLPEFERYQRLAQTSVASQSEWQKVEGYHRLLSLDVELAKSRLAILTTGSKPEDILAAEALVENLIRELDALEQRRQTQAITSPIEGWLSMGGDETALLSVGVIDSMVARILVPQEYGLCPQVGEPIVIRVPGQEEQFITGTLCRVDRRMMETPAGPVFSAYALLANTDHRFEEGMQGEARVVCGSTTALEFLLRGVDRIFTRELWSF